MADVTMPNLPPPPFNLAEVIQSIISWLWFIPLITVIAVWSVQTLLRRVRRLQKPTETALYLVYIPTEIGMTILLTYYNLEPTGQLLYATTTEKAFSIAASTAKSNIQVGYIIFSTIVILYVVECAARFDTINWQLTMHHIASFSNTALLNYFALSRPVSESLDALLTFDCAMLAMQWVCWDFIPHVSLLCRRINDGYHSVKLSPGRHGWRFYCKQIEHAFYVLSVTFLPLQRTAVIVIQILFYLRMQQPVIHSLMGNPHHFFTTTVVVQSLFFTATYMSQWVGTYVIYRHLLLKSLQEQRRATALTAAEAEEQELLKQLQKSGAAGSQPVQQQLLGDANMLASSEWQTSKPLTIMEEVYMHERQSSTSSSMQEKELEMVQGKHVSSHVF